MFINLNDTACTQAGCKQDASVVAARLERRICRDYGYFCRQHASEYLDEAEQGSFEVSYAEYNTHLLFADVAVIALSETGSVFLLRTTGDFSLRVHSGPCEGYLALSRLNTSDRTTLLRDLPATFFSVVKLLDGLLDSIVITDITADSDVKTFETMCSFVIRGRHVFHPMRATDALSVAYASGLPIVVREEACIQYKKLPIQKVPWE